MAGKHIRDLARQLDEARVQIFAANERAEVAEKKCVAMEHELAQEKRRYDQLRKDVDRLVAATTNVTNAVASPWHSPRLASRSSTGGQGIRLPNTPSSTQHPHWQHTQPSNTAASDTSYDDEAEPP